MVNYQKLKTNLRLSINRLKLLEKKKTELALKARKEIADYLIAGKVERARIRVEHIIREDYLVEAMEIVEMLCDLLLARFGLIEQMKTLDDGIAEAVSSLIWVAPRLQSDCSELNVISDGLTHKYGKQYAAAARENALKTVNAKLIKKMGIEAPPKILVEKYLIEIAKSNNLNYEPDPNIMNDSVETGGDVAAELIDLGPAGPIYAPPPLPSMPPSEPYPPSGATNLPIGFQVPPVAPTVNEKDEFLNPNSVIHPPVVPPQTPIDASLPPNYNSVVNKPGPTVKPVPKPRNIGFDNLPDLPDVPNTIPNRDDDDDKKPPDDNIDFDDLAKRFEALKKRK
ncbi:IST1-like protein [Leptotrombidium deliense]|uniref:IST1 homolog n=1 Tax=Leptotrombidium deliense TaxID=299467 RepID=A0A443SJ28_9ACAR|nr:IST1-like protein [Leptotrombidium deliense]